MKKINFIIFVSALMVSQINAQLSFGIITNQQYNNNPFQSPIPIESLVSTYDFTISNNMNEYELSYYGSYINLIKIPERNFYWHQLAFTKNDSVTSLGVVAEQRIGKDVYTYFDFKNIYVFYSRNLTNDFFNININPLLSYNTYDEIKILNNIKLTLNYKISKSLENGTTLFLGGSFNFKKYLNPTQSGYYTYLDSNNVLHKEFYTDQNINSLVNLSSYVRIAQSVTETTGLAFQYANKTIFNKISDTNKELNVIYGDESAIFDDPANLQGNFYAVELTQIFMEDWQLRLGYYLNKKFYPTQGVYEDSENYFLNKMRADKQTIFGISISKAFTFDFLNESNLNLSLNFQSINNNSNSYWFNYKNTTFGINLGFQF